MWSERGENCGRGLAPDGGGSDTDVVTDTPTSGASPLPHLICVVLTGGLIAAGDLFHQFCMPLHIIRPRNGLDHQQVIAGTAEEGGVQRLAAALGGRAVDLAQAKALEGQFLFVLFLEVGQGGALVLDEASYRTVEELRVIVFNGYPVVAHGFGDDDHTFRGLV